jgi:hypothetical protein
LFSEFKVITALLALITQQHQSSEVNVSYVIAMNVWMIICITFVFFGLIEYAIAIAYTESRERIIVEKNNKVKPNSEVYIEKEMKIFTKYLNFVF